MTDADFSPESQKDTAPPANPGTANQNKGGSAKSNAIWMGTAVGIGSAALVAALMYARRRK